MWALQISDRGRYREDSAMTHFGRLEEEGAGSQLITPWKDDYVPYLKQRNAEFDLGDEKRNEMAAAPAGRLPVPHHNVQGPIDVIPQ